VFRAQATLAAGPRPRTRLGTRLALVLVPLILIPLLIMGGAAYLRSRDILRARLNEQMSTTAQQEMQTLTDWAATRQERVQIGSQRAFLLAAARTLQGASPTEDVRVRARAELRSLMTREGELLFSELMIVRIVDGRVLVSSRLEDEGQIFDGLLQGRVNPESLTTTPLYDDALLSAQTLAMVTTAPMHALSETTVDSALIGVNRDVRLGALMEGMQTFWEQRGIYRVEEGTTFLALAPDVVISLDRYSMIPTVRSGMTHPVFALGEASASGVQNYRSFDDLAVVGAYQWSPEWNMGVVLELPQSVIFADLNSLAPFTAILVLAAILVSTAIVLYVTARMLRPLETLTLFSERISRGEWSHRVPEERQDELGTLAGSLNRMAEELSGLYRSLEARVEERTRQIRTAAEVARAVTSTPQLDDLLRRAVDLIRDRFGFYHVSIFLLDHEGKVATLRESTGQVGAVLKARGHSLPVGSQSVIGWVTANNEPRIASDVGRDPVHLANELLPETKSEAAVPLQVAGRVLGALDVQSAEPGAFTPEMVEVLQTLADQLSAAIQNARLAQESAQAADRSRLISEVSSQFSGLMDIERVLETAAQTLHRVLGQPEVVIQLTPPGSTPPNGDEAGI
jgi:HAMP domain-containing protein